MADISQNNHFAFVMYVELHRCRRRRYHATYNIMGIGAKTNMIFGLFMRSIKIING